MKWRDAQRSENVEDRRGMRVGRASAGIGGGALLLIIIFSLLTGENPLDLLQQVGPVPDSAQVGTGGPSSGAPAANDEESEFVRAVLGETEVAWGSIFAGSGRQYAKPSLVLYTNAVESACGFGSAAVGPFYCPGDAKVYLDLSFFEEMSRRFGASGDFAAAYVIAHEVGPSRPEADRRRSAGRAPPPAPRSGGRERPLGAGGAPGRLFRRGVWPSRGSEGPARGGGRRGRAAGRRGHRRRSDPAPDAGVRGARLVHARLVGPAGRVVQARPAVRRGRAVRYLPGDPPLRIPRPHAQRNSNCALVTLPLPDVEIRDAWEAAEIARRDG